MRRVVTLDLLVAVGRRPVPALAALAAVIVPLSVDDLTRELLATFLVFSLVALSLDLVWGYAGIISIGQFAFFGLGAYSMAMVASHFEEPNRVAYLLGLLAAVAVPSVAAFVLALIFFTARLGEIFVLVTIAAAIILERIAVNQTELFGGINGMALPFWMTPTALTRFLYIVIVVVAALYLLAWLVVRSPVGKVLAALKDSEQRVQYLGYDTRKYKVFVFAFAGGLAGLGGALYAILRGFVYPGLLGFELSFDAVVWLVVGGIGTLYGALIGTLGVNFAKFYTSGVLLEYWLLIIGVAFILIVVFFPRGLAGMVDSFKRRLRDRTVPTRGRP